MKRVESVDDDEKRWWSDLPYEVLELICKRLFFIDQVNFRAVCKSWRCIRRVPPLQQIPWLLVFDDKVNSCELVSKGIKTYTIDAKVIKDKLKITSFDALKVHESRYGWLLVSKNYQNYTQVIGATRLFLYSPFFDEKYNFIEFPILYGKVSFAAFASNPLDEDCEILTLNTKFYDNSIIINTCRRGQSSWSSRIFNCDQFKPRDARSWMYSEGMFYYVTGNGTVGKFDSTLVKWNVFPPLPSSIAGLSHLEHYIIESSNGELFLILDHNLRRTSSQKWCYDSHRIYRLDLSLMIWEELCSIGDHVLFIGEGYNSILKFNDREWIGISTNTIYYCAVTEMKCCEVRDYTMRCSDRGRPDPIHDFGSITRKGCRMLLIDPPR